MLLIIWNELLYEPVFNGLIWIYNNWADQNFGWSVVYLTIILRVALLPFTLVTEKARASNIELEKELERLDKELSNDPILRKEEIRRVLKQRKVKPWAKAVVLGIQGLMLLLLYQVFLRGITGEKIIQILYPTIEFPGKINTIFYGFDLGAPYDWFWAGIVAVFLMLEIYIEFHRQKGGLTKRDLSYFILFPVAVFIALYVLPMVKALFILTSIVFSAVIHQFSMLLFRGGKRKKPKSITK
jgi:membrane protein insertase Oxa1/YidC/SpoIIIJ